MSNNLTKEEFFEQCKSPPSEQVPFWVQMKCLQFLGIGICFGFLFGVIYTILVM